MFTLPRLRFVSVLLACLVFTSFTSALTPNIAQAKDKKNVLIVGDSVAAVLNWWKPSQKPFWISQFNLIIETHGCQKLLDVSCNGSNTSSALDLIKRHKTDNIDIVVVMTGYNDPEYVIFKNAVARINSVVRNMNATLVWGTYREATPVARRARIFNSYLQAQSVQENFALFDWNALSKGKKSWFRNNGVHMNAVGGIHFAQRLKTFLDRYVANLAP